MIGGIECIRQLDVEEAMESVFGRDLEDLLKAHLNPDVYRAIAMMIPQNVGKKVAMKCLNRHTQE